MGIANSIIITVVFALINPIIIFVFDALIIVNIVKDIKENNSNKKNKTADKIFIILLVLMSLVFILRYILLFMGMKGFFVIENIFEFIIYLILFVLSKFKKRSIGIIVTILSCIVISFFSVVHIWNSIDYVDTSTMVVEAHNSDFEEYYGEYVSASNTKTLISKVKIYNIEESAKDIIDLRKMYIMYNDEVYEDNLEELLKKITTSKHYKIYTLNNEKSNVDDTDAGYYKNGYIKTIVIEDAKNKASN